MSKFGSEFICARCFAFDEDSATVEIERLRAAEQRVRELCETPHVYVVSTDDVLDIIDGKHDLSGLADLGYDAALDGGQS